jgi:hypothetical protein
VDVEKKPILHRICCEFLEMPGLQLTVGQARRLWTLDDATCRRLLESLVEAKFLRRTEQGTYMRLTAGPVEYPIAGPGRARRSGQR